MPAIQPSQPYERPQQQFKGLLPAFDPRNVNQPFVLKGQNFLVDTFGPYSAFYNRIANYDHLIDGSIVQTFKLDNASFLCVKNAVFAFESSTGKYVLQYTFDDTGDVWPWSMALVSGVYFFCRKGVGVLVYDPINNAWDKLSTFVPDDPRAVCEAVGRLVVVGKAKFAWSAQDDGSNLTPSLVNGAGFDFLSAYVGGEGVSVRTAADGFYTITTKGWFKSEYNFVFNSATAPFRHYPVPGSHSYKPINQWCITSIDDSQHIMLDARGFFSIQDNKLSPFSAAFSEWVRHKFLTKMDIVQNQTLRLSYLDDLNVLFLSISDSAKPYLYNYAFANYMPLDEWGMFNYAHYGFVDTFFAATANAGFNSGFVDQFGVTRRFVTDPYNEAIPSAANGLDIINWVPDLTNPPCYFTPNPLGGKSILVGVSEFHITAFKEYLLDNEPAAEYQLSEFNTIIEPPLVPWTPYPDDTIIPFNLNTYEDWLVLSGSSDWEVDIGDEDWGTDTGGVNVLETVGIDMSSEVIYWSFLVLQPTSLSVNSYVDIGMFHLSTGKYTDELSTVTEITLGFDASETDTDMDDYLGPAYPLDLNLDWAAGSGAEDWGSFILAQTNFDVTIFATNDDGTNTFMQEDPVLLKDNGGSRIYKCMNAGMYHHTQLKALDLNQSFHLHLLDYSAIVTGRL